MAINFVVPSEDKCVKIENFLRTLDIVLSTMSSFHLSQDWVLALESSSFQSDRSLLIQDFTEIRISATEGSIQIFLDKFKSTFISDGYNFESGAFNIEVGSARSNRGRFLAAGIAVLVAKQCKNLIEDPVNFWSEKNISSTGEFIGFVSAREMDQSYFPS